MPIFWKTTVKYQIFSMNYTSENTCIYRVFGRSGTQKTVLIVEIHRVLLDSLLSV
jgi:hypothetical protein